jgi:hypothetical protein
VVDLNATSKSFSMTSQLPMLPNHPKRFSAWQLDKEFRPTEREKSYLTFERPIRSRSRCQILDTLGSESFIIWAPVYRRNQSHAIQKLCSELLPYYQGNKIPHLCTRHTGQRRRISLPVRGAGYELLIPFRGYSAELKRERNQRSLACWS